MMAPLADDSCCWSFYIKYDLKKMLKAIIKVYYFPSDLVCWLMKNWHLLFHLIQTFQSVFINRRNCKPETQEWNINCWSLLSQMCLCQCGDVSLQLVQRENLRCGSMMPIRGLDPVLAAAPRVRTPLSATSITPFSKGKLSLVLV